MAVLLFSIFGIVLLAKSVWAADNDTLHTGERLITIHDRNVEKSVITEKNTLREVFKEENIIIDPNDIIEPGLDEELPGNNYQVNIYRARPITVIDGEKRVPVMSAYQTPQDIVEHAGLKLRDEDIAKIDLSKDLLNDGLGLRLEIDRAIPLTLMLYGDKTKVYTQATTIGDFLKEKNIKLGKKDTLSVKLTGAIAKNMKIEIWHNGKQTVTKKQKINFPVEKIYDADRDAGYRKVKTAGSNGLKKVTYEITHKNGKVVKRKVIQSITLKKARKQVEIIGTKPKAVKVSGTCGEWIKGAGITDTANANYLIQKESGCNPNAYNGGSGACGVAQELPCGKSGCSLGDGACQVKWMNSYVLSRYGSWANAVAHSQRVGWY